jgi:hypothetical protein
MDPCGFEANSDGAKTMATLNVSIVEAEGLDGEVLGEAMCALQWAAEAGPFSLAVRELQLGSELHPDAVLLGCRTTGDAELELHRALGVFAGARVIRTIPAGLPSTEPRHRTRRTDWLLLRSTCEGPAAADSWARFSDDRLLSSAADLATKRRGRIVAVNAAGEFRPSVSPVGGDLETRRMSATEFVAAATDDPEQFDVVVLEDAAAVEAGARAELGLGPGALVSSVWLGRHSPIFGTFVEPRQCTTPAAITRAVAEAVSSVALLLEWTAARPGLANTLRESLELALDDLAAADEYRADAPSLTGQAVLERLEERFPLCVSW